MNCLIRLFRGTLPVFMVIIAGCHAPAPNLPKNWISKPVAPTVFADEGKDQMHIFIIYASRMCSHTALRIHSTRAGTVFWDPAGGYGEPEYAVRARRIRDLVVDPVPSVEDYLSFRQYLPTPKMEIFEFQLDPDDAERLVRLLQTALEPDGDGERYVTRTDPFYCCSRISEFLEDHAQTVLPVHKTFFPHDFAEMLYQLKHSRVYIYEPLGLWSLHPQ